MLDCKISLYYGSAAIAVMGTVGYHSLIKQIPATVDPMVSIIGIYIGVVLLGLFSIPFIYHHLRIVESVRQFGWIQLGIGVCILAMELGFVLMYRSGWDVSAGNVVTGVFINLALLTIGILVFQEKLNGSNMLGIFVCIIGVAMIQHG